MKDTLYFGTAVLLLLFAASGASAHPDHVPSAVTSASVGAATPSNADAEALHYYYQLMARLSYESPAPIQTALFEAMRNIVHIQVGIPGAPETPQLLEELHALEHRIEDVYLVLKAHWGAEAVTLLPPPSPVSVARGLPRHLLLSLTNDTTNQLAVTGLPVKDVPNGPPISIPPKGTRLVPVHILAEAPTTSADLVLLPSGEGAAPRTVHVLVSFSEPATVRVKSFDDDTGEITPGRIYARGSDGCYRHGRAFADNTTLTEKFIGELLTMRFQYYRLPFSYSDGMFESVVPPGRTELVLERGFEHPLATQVVDLAPGEVRDVELRSRRFADMRAMGWVSGDTHVHWVKNSWDVNEDINLLAMVQRAEDLRVANNLTLYQWRADDQGGPFTKPDHFSMGPVPGHDGHDYYIEMAEEYRNDMFYGHLVFLNLKELIRPIATGQGSGGPPGTPDWPLNKWAIGQARAQGGISIEAHNLGPFFRSDVPVNVVSGMADSLDQLDPEHYYRFLDVGARIPLSNGSDHPARVVGCARVYVRVEGDFTYDRWIEGIRRGRTFTTSGPLLLLTVNDIGVGDEVRATRGDTVKVVVKAMSRRPLGTLQLVHDGRVVKALETSDREAKLQVDLPLAESGWVVARCAPSGRYSAIEGPDIAHTSAVYLTVDGRPVFRAPAAQYWIENMRQHAANVASNAVYENDAQRREQVDYINQAIAVLESRLAEVTAP